MKKNIFKLGLLLSLLLVFLLSSCYQSNIDALSTFKFKLPVNFYSNHNNKIAPDTSIDFSNLYKYKEYRDNEDKVKKSMLYQFNYWIDSLHLENEKPFDPAVDEIEFEFIVFKLVFAKPGPGNWGPTDVNADHWLPDESLEVFTLGRFDNVNVSEYYRYPYHIEEVPDDVAKKVSEILKVRPQFYILTEYSHVVGVNGDYHFPFVKARYDIVIEFEVDL